MAYRAFVSSTFKDLACHREWANAALLDAGFAVDPMERWTADTGEPKEVSQKRVEGCDLCLLLVGFRRGYIPDDSQISITQMEYARALEEGCDVLVFLLEEGADWPAEFDDRDRDPQLVEWRSQLQKDRVVGYFDERPESLNIAPALTRWVQQREGLQVKRVPLGIDLLNLDKQTKIEVIVSTQKVEEETKVPAGGAGLGPNPYKGLAAFQEEDADRYFGRDKQIERLWERFRELNERGAKSVRILPVLGPSGSGKSSLVRAGLIPQLARRPLAGKERARVLVFTPGVRPLWMLAGMLARVADKESKFRDPRYNDDCLRQADEDGEFDGLQRIADLLPRIDTSPLILVVDQFEEIYAPDVKERERRAFIDNLLFAAGDGSGRISAILTLRSDFLGQTQRHSALNQAIAAQEITIPAMSAEELEEAIALHNHQTQSTHLGIQSISQISNAKLEEQKNAREGPNMRANFMAVVLALLVTGASLLALPACADSQFSTWQAPKNTSPDTRFDRQRLQMVEQQLRDRGIQDEAVLNAMSKVPRHKFVPPLPSLRRLPRSPLTHRLRPNHLATLHRRLHDRSRRNFPHRHRPGNRHRLRLSSRHLGRTGQRGVHHRNPPRTSRTSQPHPNRTGLSKHCHQTRGRLHRLGRTRPLRRHPGNSSPRPHPPTPGRPTGPQRKTSHPRRHFISRTLSDGKNRRRLSERAIAPRPLRPPSRRATLIIPSTHFLHPTGHT